MALRVATARARYRLFIPDLVGCGETEKPEADYHPDRVARFVGEVCDTLGLAALPAIGNSMGGYLCMRLALARPTLLSRLCNLHSPGLATARMTALKWALNLVPGWEAILRRVVQANVERWVHKNVHYYDETLKSREEQAQFGAPLATPDGFYGFARILEQTMSVDAMRELETILGRTPFPIPLQLVYAERDPMVPPAVGQRLHALCPAAEYVVLKNASHFAHVDATERFLDAAMPFLEAKA